MENNLIAGCRLYVMLRKDAVFATASLREVFLPKVTLPFYEITLRLFH